MNHTTENLIKMAEVYGIKCTPNSSDPGFYVSQEDGTSKKVDLLELFWLKDDSGE